MKKLLSPKSEFQRILVQNVQQENKQSNKSPPTDCLLPITCFVNCLTLLKAEYKSVVVFFNLHFLAIFGRKYSYFDNRGWLVLHFGTVLIFLCTRCPATEVWKRFGVPPAETQG